METNSQRQLKYIKTRNGLIAKIYGAQKYNSKRRGHIPPNYTKLELRVWVLSQPNFEQLYSDWVASDYDKMMIPSCDREDDDLPYTLDTLTLMTWEENDDKGRVAKKKYVIQYTLDDILIKKYSSQKEAENKSGVSRSNISKCCRGKRKQAGGFKWKYKTNN